MALKNLIKFFFIKCVISYQLSISFSPERAAPFPCSPRLRTGPPTSGPRALAHHPTPAHHTGIHVAHVCALVAHFWATRTNSSSHTCTSYRDTYRSCLCTSPPISRPRVLAHHPKPAHHTGIHIAHVCAQVRPFLGHARKLIIQHLHIIQGYISLMSVH